MKSQGKKVFVGLSGGVDSAVSAALLKQQGFDVTGVFIKAWSPPGFVCTWKEDRRSAMRAAAVLDIPFLTLDLEKEYKQEVVDYMIREYKEGKTPNPDVMCNKEIKFGHFLKFALANGADYVATVHYAKLTKNKKESFVLSGAKGKEEKVGPEVAEKVLEESLAEPKARDRGLFEEELSCSAVSFFSSKLYFTATVIVFLSTSLLTTYIGSPVCLKILNPCLSPKV